MEPALAPLLQCPRCGGALSWEADQARCLGCASVYPERGGVALFLLPETRPPDPWGQSASGLLAVLRQDPDLERRLMDTPLGSLAPADRYFRSYVQRLRGEWAASLETKRLALPALYPAEWLAAKDRMLDALVDRIDSDGSLVDIACGEGALVSRIATEHAFVVATDVSPQVLVGAYERVRLQGGHLAGALAFDARQTPFRDGAARTLTTFLGLANIGDVAVLRELRRIGRRFLGVEQFFDPSDIAHMRALRDAGRTVPGRDEWLAAFRSAGWTVAIVATERTVARPTPVSVLIPGAGIDGVPLTDTSVEWCLLEAS